jgi:hypothetical protein
MAVTNKIEVVGIKEALRELNQIDKSLRRQITKEFKAIGAPVVNEAKNMVPKTPPISGWGRPWTTKSDFKMLPWNGAIGAKYIDTQVSSKRPREFQGKIQDLAVVAIRWRGAVNTVYDLAQKPKTVQGATMIRGLQQNKGKASRVMWPAYSKNADKVEDQIRDQIVKVMELTNRAINKGAI